MTFTYDLSTDIGRVRALIPDRTSDTAIFTDEEIQYYLDLELNVRRATAIALEAIATDQALLLKVMQSATIQTDGAKLMTALLARAKTLREQADDDDALVDAAFDWAELVVDEFSAEHRLRNEILRQQT